MAGENDKAAGADAPAAAAFPEDGAWAERADRPAYEVVLWPNRSLTRPARKRVFALVAVGLAVPLLPALGTPVFWGLLPFCLVAFGALWVAFRRSDADGRLSEHVTLWADEMRVERREPSGRIRRWRADPYWVRLTVHADARPENYLTVKGGGREIELGAFLSPEERTALAEEIEAAIRRVLTRGPG